MIDSHCHLADKKFHSDLAAVLERAARAGVDRMVTIADSIEESNQCVRIAEEHEQIFCTVGVHPHNAKHWKNTDAATLRSLTQSSKKVKAIGEIGLDYHYNFSPKEAQQNAFREQLVIAKNIDLPVVIHCREAINDLQMILTEIPGTRFVVHCCTEKWDDVRDLVDQGCLLSFTGIATYPNAPEIRDCIAHCPLSQMMIETDAPYLAPVPHRGKRNEPAYVTEVAKLIATIKEVDVGEVDRVTTQNAVAFFGL